MSFAFKMHVEEQSIKLKFQLCSNLHYFPSEVKTLYLL